MKKKLFMFLISLFMIMSLNSCDVYTYATTQDDIYIETQADVVKSDVDFNVIIRYGTPYYYNGALLYYLYNDLYYYPFYYNNYWYVRAYRRPFDHLHYRPYFRPHRYDYKFSPGHYRGFDRPNRPEQRYRHNPNMRRPDYYPRQPRPDVGNRRPDQPKINGNSTQRPSQTRPNTRLIPRGNTDNHNRHFGERR